MLPKLKVQDIVLRSFCFSHCTENRLDMKALYGVLAIELKDKSVKTTIMMD